MKQILIIEDDSSLRKYLIRKANQINQNIEIKSTDSAKEALEIARDFDIKAFFIDIQLVDYSGLEVAKQIREINKYRFAPMVFITAVPSRELEAFRQVHCYEYIIKPFTDKELEDIFRRILIGCIEESQKQVEKIHLDSNGIRQLIDEENIIFIEYELRKIVIHLKDSVLKYKHMPLKRFAEQLSDDFIQIHQSIIINKNFIKTIDQVKNYVLLEYSDFKIPIGKTYRKEVGDWLDGRS